MTGLACLIEHGTREELELARKLSNRLIRKLSIVRKQVDDPEPFEIDWFLIVRRGYDRALRDLDLPVSLTRLLASARIIDGKPRFDSGALAAFNREISRVLGPEFAGPALEQAKKITENMYKASQEVVAEALKVTPSFDGFDQATVNILNQSDTLAISSMYDRTLAPVVNRMVINTLEEGFGAPDLAARMEDRIGGFLTNRGRANINVVASHSINTSRNFARINQFSDVGVQTYEFIAILDKKTTPVCRYMDGRTFKVANAQKLVNRQTNFGEVNEGNFDDWKAIRPWGKTDMNSLGSSRNSLFLQRGGGQKRFLPGSSFSLSSGGVLQSNAGIGNTATNNKLEKLGFQIPPLHANCRSTVVISDAEISRLT